MPTYIGQVKTINWKFWSFQKISFSEKQIDEMKTLVNSKGYINLNMNPRKEIGKYGETHTLTIDEYLSDGETQKSSIQPKQARRPMSDEITIEDIPF